MTMLSKMTSEEQQDAVCCPIGMTLMEDPVISVEQRLLSVGNSSR